MNSADLIARFEWAEEQVMTYAHDDQASKFCDNFTWLLAEELRKALMAAREEKRAQEALSIGKARQEALRAAEAFPDKIPGDQHTSNCSRSGW